MNNNLLAIWDTQNPLSEEIRLILFLNGAISILEAEQLAFSEKKQSRNALGHIPLRAFQL